VSQGPQVLRTLDDRNKAMLHCAAECFYVLQHVVTQLTIGFFKPVSKKAFIARSS